MPTHDTDEIATWLATWLRKPFLTWSLLANVSIGLAAAVAAVVTGLWWLLFIPLLAFVECSALCFGAIFAEVLRSRDAEIERLRRELHAL